jgi:hypothetical protein
MSPDLLTLIVGFFKLLTFIVCIAACFAKLREAENNYNADRSLEQRLDFMCKNKR